VHIDESKIASSLFSCQPRRNLCSVIWWRQARKISEIYAL